MKATFEYWQFVKYRTLSRFPLTRLAYSIYALDASRVLIVNSPRPQEFIDSKILSLLYRKLRLDKEQNMSTPSSRRSGRSGRGSQKSTPTKTSRSTPQPARQQASNNAPASSSPLFYRSSPANSTPRQSQQQRGNLNISSPPRQSSVIEDREATPKAARIPNAGGKCHIKSVQTMRY